MQSHIFLKGASNSNSDQVSAISVFVVTSLCISLQNYPHLLRQPYAWEHNLLSRRHCDAIGGIYLSSPPHIQVGANETIN